MVKTSLNWKTLQTATLYQTDVAEDVKLPTQPKRLLISKVRLEYNSVRII